MVRLRRVLLLRWWRLLVRVLPVVCAATISNARSAVDALGWRSSLTRRVPLDGRLLLGLRLVVLRRRARLSILLCSTISAARRRRGQTRRSLGVLGVRVVDNALVGSSGLDEALVDLEQLIWRDLAAG